MKKMKDLWEKKWQSNEGERDIKEERWDEMRLKRWEINEDVVSWRRKIEDLKEKNMRWKKI